MSWSQCPEIREIPQIDRGDNRGPGRTYFAAGVDLGLAKLLRPGISRERVGRYAVTADGSTHAATPEVKA